MFIHPNQTKVVATVVSYRKAADTKHDVSIVGLMVEKVLPSSEPDFIRPEIGKLMEAYVSSDVPLKDGDKVEVTARLNRDAFGGIVFISDCQPVEA